MLPSFLMVVGLGSAYVRYGGLPWMQAAFYGVGASVIGIIARSAYGLTVAAVVPGAIDFVLVVPGRGPASRVAALHAVLGLSLLVLYGINLALRLGAPAGAASTLPAVGLSAGGLGLLALTAWFGGELVYRYRIGVREHL